MITTCGACNICKTVIDLTIIKPVQYKHPGHVILRDLEKCGFVVCRGVLINSKGQDKIDILVRKGENSLLHIIWLGIEIVERQHKMKYEYNSKVPPDWKMDNQFFHGKIKDIYDRLIPNNRCIIGIHTLFQSSGLVKLY